jgi:hypothetical protein
VEQTHKPAPSAAHDEDLIAGSRIVIPTGIRPAVSHAFAAIQRVHHVPSVNPIAFTSDDTMEQHGKFIWSLASGRPVEIRIRPTSDHRELTALLEIGHWLDHQAIGAMGEFASISHPILAAWRAAVGNSVAVQKLENFLDAGTVPYKDPSGRTRHMPVARFVQYLLNLPELFSRSYAQWIASESHDELILRQIAAVTGSNEPAGILPKYWDAGDFETISLELDSVMIKVGWKRR